MEPIFLTIYLDKNNDGELSKEEVRVFIKKFGSGKNKSDSDVEKVIEILDQDKNNKIDRNEFISYYSYASCIGCDKK